MNVNAGQKVERLREWDSPVVSGQMTGTMRAARRLGRASVRTMLALASRLSIGEVMTTQVQCVELGRLSVPGMRIKVRWFPEGAPDEQIWRAPSNILSFSRVIGDAVLHRIPGDSSEFRAIGPLTFWPRSSVCASRRQHCQILAVSTYFDANFATGFDMKPEGMPIDDFSMVELMQLLHDEVTSPSPGSQGIVSAVGDILRIKLSRLISQRTRNPGMAKPCRNGEVAMLHGLIHRKNGRLPSTTELSEQFNTSRRSLHRLFKATTGAAPSRYIEEMKLDRAKTLLATSKLTMKQIAHEAGYATASHFSARFRRLTGLTPSAFRKKARRSGSPPAT
jgi:AraC-like DNA-binding protein